MKFILSSFLFFFILGNNVNAQSYTPILINYTKENGLPSNETYCVIKDKKGYIWIGTDKGVVRYNGNKFQKFDLPDNVVFKIKEADDGKIWFFTYTGKLSYFLNDKIYPYKYNDTIQKYAQRLLISDAYIFKNDELLIKSINLYDYQILQNGTIKLLHKHNNHNSLFDSLHITKKESQIVITHTSLNQVSKKNIILINKLSGSRIFELANPNGLPIKSSRVYLCKLPQK
jgi:ligand-binding sensor domain-containing protein